jgi:hypothetical protein
LARYARRALPPQLLLDAGATQGPSLIGMRAIAAAFDEGVASRSTHPRVVFGPLSTNLQAA